MLDASVPPFSKRFFKNVTTEKYLPQVLKKLPNLV